MALVVGHMFYVDTYREKLKKSSCLKQETFDIWYFDPFSGPLPKAVKL